MQHSKGFLALVEEARGRIQEITIEQYRHLLESGAGHVLIDIREESEWAAGRAAGARHIGRGILERDIEAAIPDPTTPIVLYCGGGYRSALSADSLQKMGYGSVYSLAGGWRAWREACMQVEGAAEQG